LRPDLGTNALEADTRAVVLPGRELVEIPDRWQADFGAEMENIRAAEVHADMGAPGVVAGAEQHEVQRFGFRRDHSGVHIDPEVTGAKVRATDPSEADAYQRVISLLDAEHHGSE